MRMAVESAGKASVILLMNRMTGKTHSDYMHLAYFLYRLQAQQQTQPDSSSQIC